MRRRFEQVTYAPVTRDVSLLRSRLLAWYRRHKRDYPWRRRPDFYRTLVAEFMLQQTRSDQALPYFLRFVKLFPTLHRLAKASPQEVLKAWEGLGYYRRAGQLHDAAKRFDRRRLRLSDLRGVPGVGAYTFAAVGSIVFGEPLPVVDGNVRRVMSRVLALKQPPERKSSDLRIRLELADWISRRSPAAFNQAMMELGSTLCSPRLPQCRACPLSAWCGGYQQGRPEAFPVRPPTKIRPHREIAAAVIRRKDGRILIAQRPADGLLPNLWEFPGGKRQRGETLRECCAREIQEELSIGIAVGRKLERVEHAYSHFSVTLHFFECRHTTGRPRARGCQAFRWTPPKELVRYPFPRANWALVSRLSGRPFPS